VDRLITSDPQDWCVFGPCPRPAPPEPSGGSAASSYEAYADKAVATDRNYERIGVSVYGWLGINNFQQLVDASVRNPDFCIRFLSDKKRSERQRRIAILAMYKLSIDQHVVFVRNLATLRDRGSISPEELMRGLLPRFSDLVIEQYRNPKIQALLKEIEAQDDIPAEMKTNIRSYRSGQRFAWKRTSEWDRECTRWSEMRSISACASLATQILKAYAIYWVTW
jgi:hypothetical protein